MRDISDTEWQKLHPLIVSIFQRNKGAAALYLTWCTYSFNYKKNQTYLNCHICDKSIVIQFPSSTQETRQHALFHLKEHNLLPFI